MQSEGQNFSQKIKWCAIGDSITYLNDHLDETAYRLKKGYLQRVCEQLPELTYINCGINGSTTQDWLSVDIPDADIYSILLGTNDWNKGIPPGTRCDFTNGKAGTIMGNIGDLVKKIRMHQKKAPIIIMNPVERADFVYINDPNNNAHGSYAPNSGQWLCDISRAIFEGCTGENIYTVDLHGLSGFNQNNVIRFKYVKKDGSYERLPYPSYVCIKYDPLNDEYPYPLEAVGLTYDGLHPSDEGCERIAEVLVNCFRKVLNKD